ncbi:restriction endonuclease subunit S [Knoellia sp. 3-2P3]|uniref:restriction endonuclease subunit S n=1 Tax=unclassified Knoellia TaxID=2618719 RepID=UPI0023D9E295|nr:restriction endonuclease subunit S [Knoellia sp. 3-2P3]MDF2090833.1 restriction endonuclease subunit S [Knoellia sp. 3-2P3]
MSRIDDLIAEHCPAGVPFKALGEVGTLVRGSGLQKKDFVDTGFPCIHYGQIYTFYGTSATVTKSFIGPELAARLKKAETGDLVITTTSENIEDVCTAVAWLGEVPIAIGGHSCVFKHTLDPMYAAYYFQTEQFELQKRKFVSGTKVKDIKISDIARVKIPVPPLAIQREIAAILDKMESLKAELEAELELRSRQYAFYRNDLVAFGSSGSVEWLPMGHVGEFIRGRRFTKKDVVDRGLACINFGEIYTHYGTFAHEVISHVRADLGPGLRFARRGDVVLTGVSETVEDICKAVAWLGEGEVAVHDDCFIYRHNLNPKFVSYYLQTSGFNDQKAKHVARAKVKRISAESLSSLLIPVPPAAEQERIVAVLDKFDALVNDLSYGLPAEIKARQAQYEYYRDKLLTFEELAA